ncbi:DUF2637 domain-containing protein [Streptomyces sp. CS131]|uniref:DUF2637 domain-containing protein n=1 Tax=Streptomyces sp. CS131 TaxID=2162711 RepID=UPI000D514DA1|nr:DUF2637 domain-containing protein [Streptomyces sp. CS131]PVC76934.1 hypothetical protein DBP20_35260 [Streptomyces sp. CS131]
MTKSKMERAALIAAGLVIVVLTAGAFWLSYAHLAEVAGQHGLAASPIRQWAWPATLDLFIVGGELLMLRAGLQGRTDWWAITATAAGSVGSIVLNVAGVAGSRDAAAVPLLDYVTAAVPPTAALLAFGLLMRQVHGLVADSDPAPVPVVTVERDTTPSPVDTGVSPTPALDPAPADASPLVICGAHLEIPPVPPRPRLDTEAARAAIEQAWRDGLSVREAARVSTRGSSQVQRVYAQLDAQKPIEGQTVIEVGAVAA